ncbi:hypothetical protein TNCT_706691 [Trichonephila clavata]|uniref:C2H2-type domain-containing protein n=1 Tax=Trichonephila clavata TaxID=2740835 RepID=A0A8X6M105_TRICU|nr:hypothetical protein TNCT_706691 [Trichonephila clavata]
MAEANLYLPEEEISYICSSCVSSKRNERKWKYTFIVSPGSCLTCIKCGKSIDTGFKREKKSSNHTSSHRCDVCSMTFPNSSRLLYHSYDHSGDWPIRCWICQKGFPILSLSEIHCRLRDTVRDFYCHKCLRHFRANVCPGIFTVHCEKCSDGLSSVKYVTS